MVVENAANTIKKCNGICTWSITTQHAQTSKVFKWLIIRTLFLKANINKKHCKTQSVKKSKPVGFFWGDRVYIYIYTVVKNQLITGGCSYHPVVNLCVEFVCWISVNVKCMIYRWCSANFGHWLTPNDGRSSVQGSASFGDFQSSLRWFVNRYPAMGPRHVRWGCSNAGGQQLLGWSWMHVARAYRGWFVGQTKKVVY